MANKSTTTKKKTFPFESPLVKQTEQNVVEGYQSIESKEQDRGEPKPQTTSMSTTTSSTRPAIQEQTKGIQAYIPMSMYLKMVNLKYERGETLGNMVVQAIAFWLEKQVK